MKDKVVVAVPIYKASLADGEKNSLKQMIHVLGDHPICFFTYPELDFSEYDELMDSAPYSIEYFDKRWFKDTGSYNKLLISKKFYCRFLQYEFILIYQLDAWVFRDELNYWCDKGFDYIGAPWFADYDLAGVDSKFVGVGNGGLSLRKVESHIRALNSFAYVRPPRIIIKELFSAPNFKSFVKALGSLTVRNNIFFLFNDYQFNEDHFWCRVVGRRYAWYRIADFHSASRFSMELNASFLFERNGNVLPFGCHKWEQYQPDFWAQFIGNGR